MTEKKGAQQDFHDVFPSKVVTLEVVFLLRSSTCSLCSCKRHFPWSCVCLIQRKNEGACVKRREKQASIIWKSKESGERFCLFSRESLLRKHLVSQSFIISLRHCFLWCTNFYVHLDILYDFSVYCIQVVYMLFGCKMLVDNAADSQEFESSDR